MDPDAAVERPAGVFQRYKDALKQGHVRVLRGQLEEAVEHYRAASNLAPERPLPRTALGEVLLRLGRHADARQAFDQALELAPRDERALAGREQAVTALGQPASGPLSLVDAEAALEKAIASGPEGDGGGQAASQVEQFVSAARLYAQLGQWHGAIDACHRALAVAPDSVEVHTTLAELYAARGWEDRAREKIRLLNVMLELDASRD
ncbi:MAG: tetratricopeptide repeat protein [Candidatus Limnocylindrales bacterium]